MGQVKAYLAAAMLCVAGFVTTAQAASERIMYTYCYGSHDQGVGHGYTYFYSSVFAVREDTHDVGIQNSFNSYITARLEPDFISGSLCMGLHETAREAQDKMNDAIGDTRRRGWDVVLTRWHYSE